MWFITDYLTCRFELVYTVQLHENSLRCVLAVHNTGTVHLSQHRYCSCHYTATVRLKTQALSIFYMLCLVTSVVAMFCWSLVGLQLDARLLKSLIVTSCHYMSRHVLLTGHANIDFTCLLHTYLRVPDIKDTRVLGLRGVTYIDKVRRDVV